MKKINESIIPGTNRFSHQAMATIFEIIIYHQDRTYAQQAAWEAFRELDRLELELSRFIENSDIARLNKLPANQTIRIGADLFECLKQCKILYTETGGLFDITIGSLMNCWLNEDKTIREPTSAEIDSARELTGMHLLQLNEQTYTIKLLKSPIQLDLGGFGKGYAVDLMAELLLDWELDTFLIHGGKSSLLGRGKLPNQSGWPVSISNPFNSQEPIEVIFLQNQAISASGLQKGRHIIDPRTGRPIEAKRATWAFAPTAAHSDALSTSFMTMTLPEIEKYCLDHPGVRAIILIEGQDQPEKLKHFGK